jgi:threonine/homoserine/homoserine lactone efflux protein
VTDLSAIPFLFIRSIVIGISIAAPVGPIGVLCVRRTLARGMLFGIITGLGAASADALYAMLAASGLVLVSAFLVSNQHWIRLVGGMFLCYLGIRTGLSAPAEQEAKSTRDGLAGAYSTTFFLTLTNPITIIAFVGIFAGLGLAETNRNLLTISSTVIGVFLGSMLWWLILSGIVSRFRDRFGAREMLWVNRISGVVILLFGIVAIIGVFL